MPSPGSVPNPPRDPLLPQHLLILNAGSSSVKFSVFATGDGLTLRWRGQIEGFGGSPSFEVTEDGKRILSRGFEVPAGTTAHQAAFAALFDWLFTVIDHGSLIAAGHRVVHGGGVFTEPVVIDAETLADIDALSALAPLHQPHNLAGIEAVVRLAPGLPQVACFDTAFHRTLPEPAYTFALPKALRDAGIRRYGFHGLSYENVARALPGLLAPGQRRVIAAHLGNGASLCAMLDGQSIDTTMGFTALDGLVMGTRAGSLDPGVLLHLVQAQGMNAAQLEELLYKRSGLLGLSGASSDMRTLLDSCDPQAALAIDCFVHRAIHEIGALAAALEGLDALVFTAGIGERSAEIRARICARLGWLGVALDAEANTAHRPLISKAGSKVSVLIIPADEERVIARYTLALSRMAAQGDGL
jgi:acetate kinase